MKKIKLLFLVLGIFLIGLVLGYCGDRINENEIVYKDEPTHKSYSSAISMMYETEANSGIYEESRSTSWPQEGYTFNDTLSKCENGSTLSWVDGKVKMVGNVSDKCYVYFDVYEAPQILLADYIKNTVYTGTQGENNIYFHNVSLPNGAGDNSYRYAGSYDAVENYVCMGDDENGNCPYDKLYRIIGVFGNQVKLIKADYAKSSELGTDGDYNSTYKEYDEMGHTNKGSNTKNEIGVYYWNRNNGSSSNSNIWANSKLNTVNLNQKYLNTLGTYASKVAFTTWKVGGNTFENIGKQKASTAYQNEILNPVTGQTAVNNKIGLMYVSDYMFGAIPEHWNKYGNSYNDLSSDGCSGCKSDYRSAKDSNWMFGGLNEWTITRASDHGDNAFSVSHYGYVNADIVSGGIFFSGGNAVRPVLYLESTVTMIGGSGTFADPYRLS